MENQPQDPLAALIGKWQLLSLTKKVVSIVILGIVALVLLFVITTLRNAALYSTGLSMSGDSMMMDSPMPQGMGVASKGGLNMVPPMPTEEYVTGSDAEAFETKDYTVRFETADLTGTCATITALKPKPDVIFLSASESDNSCYYQFKVANATAPTVLTTLTALNPKELTEHTASIKKQLENSLNQRTILNDNLTSIEGILTDALLAYDNLLITATEAKDSIALAQAVRDKIQLIDQLKQRRESTLQQLDYLNQQLAEQQDRLSYTYFSVNVSERVYFDLEAIQASWHYALKDMIAEVNEVLQKLSTGLITFILWVALYVIYFIIFVAIARFGWRIVRTVWRS